MTMSITKSKCQLSSGIHNVHIHDASEHIGLVSFIRSCTKGNDMANGKRVHAYALKKGLTSTNIFIGNTLISMYAKCGSLPMARQVFDELSAQTAVSWTALIAGFAQHGHGHKALTCFEQMKSKGLSPDSQTYACTLKACGSVGAVEVGEKIHAELSQEGLLGKNIFLGNAVVDMYARCGAFVKAQKVLDQLPFRNEICWNGLITRYSQYGQGERALNCYDRMQHEGLSPTPVTYACALKACGTIVAVEKGKEIHDEIVRKDLHVKNNVVGTALVDMYIKCGALKMAQQVFEELSTRNVVSWTALISGYAEVGSYDHIFDSFNKMVKEGVKPNFVTYVIVLNACRYSGLVTKGQSYFENMTTRYGIIPSTRHFICMVNLFGFAGHFDKAVSIIRKFTRFDHSPAWCALLSSCQRWGNTKLAREAFECSVGTEEVCMANRRE
ncbi:hypothetical protein KP509_04G078100 [Ceratopteris richardii]|uniref:Pentatricopeptide repeat-containing protein n=1 Tax=Ceratopteris richardii TaxID=49495 RepID=A0A8T2V1K1_CERRI|nr:hypothetical protein KP509_04G078100 [Ceratopteris richardii]